MDDTADTYKEIATKLSLKSKDSIRIAEASALLKLRTSLSHKGVLSTYDV